MDDDHEMMMAVCTLAELPLGTDMPGTADDPELDALILAARRIKERNGYEVVSLPAV